MSAALVFASVNLAQGRRLVLRDLDLTIPHGAFVGVLGANGAGKTTLMRAALGLIRPQVGRILRDGAVGYLPQTGDHLAELRLSGWDLLAASAGGIGWGVPLLAQAQRADVERVLGLTDAAAYARRPVRTLSGGERQRLLLAQALLGTPRLLLLDEPLAGLDPQHQAATVALVRRLQRQLGLTVLFSAHELNPLLPALDLVLYLGAGRAALGTVDEVVTAPVLSRLYGAPVEVVRAAGRVFVVAGAASVGAHARL